MTTRAVSNNGHLQIRHQNQPYLRDQSGIVHFELLKPRETVAADLPTTAFQIVRKKGSFGQLIVRRVILQQIIDYSWVPLT